MTHSLSSESPWRASATVAAWFARDPWHSRLRTCARFDFVNFMKIYVSRAGRGCARTFFPFGYFHSRTIVSRARRRRRADSAFRFRFSRGAIRPSAASPTKKTMRERRLPNWNNTRAYAASPQITTLYLRPDRHRTGQSIELSMIHSNASDVLDEINLALGYTPVIDKSRPRGNQRRNRRARWKYIHSCAHIYVYIHARAREVD